MNASQNQLASRRAFIKATSQIAAASALAGVAIPYVHAAEDNTIRLALIGCGGHGSGAVANAMSAGGLVLGDDSGTKRAAGTGAGAGERGGSLPRAGAGGMDRNMRRGLGRPRVGCAFRSLGIRPARARLLPASS